MSLKDIEGIYTGADVSTPNVESHSYVDSNGNIQIKKGFEFNRERSGCGFVPDKVMRLLSTPEKELKFLDLGICKIDNEEHLYYGGQADGKDLIVLDTHDVKINDYIKFKNGQEIGCDEIRELVKYDCSLGRIAPIISNNTIRKYYQASNGTLLINPSEYYKKLREIILYFMDFAGKDEIADVMACWIIGTYCYPLFYWFPHILINAPSGSGKSKCGYLIMRLSFRGFDLGASGGVSAPQIFRTLEGNRGTILIDEFERSSNPTDDVQRIVNQVINASADREAYVIRPEQINGKWVSVKFPIFCPKICCNITGINPTSLSRFLSFKWLKTLSSKGKRKPQKEKSRLLDLNEESYLFMLENWTGIKKYYDSLNLSLNNRDSDNWSPMYAIARYLDEKDPSLQVETALNKYVTSYDEIQIETEDLTADFFSILEDFVSETNIYYQPKELASIPEIADLLSTYKSPAHWIGKKLKLFGFKQSRTGKGRSWLLGKDNVQIINKTYFNIQKSSTQKETSHIDLNDYNDIKYTNDGDVCVVCDVIPMGGGMSKDDIISILLDKKEMAIIDLIKLGATQDTLDKLLLEGIVFESKSGYLKLMI